MDTWKVEALYAVGLAEQVLDDVIENLDQGIGEDVIEKIDASVRHLSRLFRQQPDSSRRLITRFDEVEAVLRYVNHAQGVDVEGVLLAILIANGAVEHAAEEMGYETTWVYNQ